MAESMNRGGGVAEPRRGPESGGVLRAGKDSAQGVASGVASAASQAWESTSAGVQQAASAVAHTAEDAWGALRGCMGRYPFATFFLGVGVGALAALALRRR
jgi:hypothetical protein